MCCTISACGSLLYRFLKFYSCGVIGVGNGFPGGTVLRVEVFKNNACWQVYMVVCNRGDSFVSVCGHVAVYIVLVILGQRISIVTVFKAFNIRIIGHGLQIPLSGFIIPAHVIKLLIFMLNCI